MLAAAFCMTSDPTREFATLLQNICLRKTALRFPTSCEREWALQLTKVGLLGSRLGLRSWLSQRSADHTTFLLTLTLTTLEAEGIGGGTNDAMAVFHRSGQLLETEGIGGSSNGATGVFLTSSLKNKFGSFGDRRKWCVIDTGGRLCGAVDN